MINNKLALIVALIIPGGLLMLGLWKGREIRAELSMMGEGWDRLHPTVKEKAIKVIEKARAAGLHVGIFEGYRTAERQAEMIRNGTSKVSDPDSSYHRWGLAVDFVFLDRLGRWSWDPEGGRDTWNKLGTIIEQEGFFWGGHFSSFFDGPHAELRLLTVTAMKQAYQSPENLKWA